MNTLSGRKNGGLPLNPPANDDRIRPGFIILLAGAAALILIPLWAFSHKEQPAPRAVASAPSAPLQVRGFVSMGDPGSFGAPASADGMPGDTGAAPLAPSAPAGPLEKTWGIRFSSVALARANTALEMVYQITGFDQARQLNGNNTGNYLLDLASGTKIPLCPPQLKQWPFPPHSGARSMALSMRGAVSFPPPAGRIVAGKTYAVLVPNPNGMLKSGSRVAVVVGGVQSEELTVR